MNTFKIDENLPKDAAILLREHGYDAMTVGEQGLAGTQDPQLLRICREEDRVLITLDLDFANVRVYPPMQHLGVVVMRPPRQDKATVMGMLRQLLPVLDSTSIDRQLWIVEPERLRVWQEHD
jgi:predicted nuclease of predicted toxin-antitoxin system